MEKRTAFFISDGTGITAETLGHSLLTQFEQVSFEQVALPYVNTPEKARETVERINACADAQPLLFTTLINPEIRAIITSSKGLLLDFLTTFLEPLEKTLKMKSSHRIGRMHGAQDYQTYKTRIDAVNYALNNDDGANIHNYEQADLIVIGVSRCGKTPTCLYLALQFGVFVANYPFTEDDMDHLRLPSFLQPHRAKLFGLDIDPQHLQSVRQERRPNSPYAELGQCQKEIRKVKGLFEAEQIPTVNTTGRSIEELSTIILSRMNLKRRLF
jgi:[pyruvate, water dikinase]-phosphate phosphotransferase / [pyruvate, water dikinase] kinase